MESYIALTLAGIALILVLVWLFSSKKSKKTEESEPSVTSTTSIEDDEDIKDLREDAKESRKELRIASIDLSNARREHQAYKKRQRAERLRDQIDNSDNPQ